MSKKISDELIQDFDENETQFAGDFLSDVFIEHHTDLSSFSENEISIIVKLIQTVTTNHMKRLMLAALAFDTQLIIIDHLDAIEKQQIFHYFDQLPLLEYLFQQLKPKQQQTLLTTLYQHDRRKYTALKKLSSQRLQMKDGILIKQEHVLALFVNQEAEDTVTMITTKKTAADEMVKKAQSIQDKYDPKDCENLAKLVISKFSKLRLPITNQSHFKTYLNFYAYIDVFFSYYPTLSSELSEIFDQIINMLNSLPDDEWTIKVLNQLPISFIIYIIKKIKNHNAAKNLEQRNIYFKLYNMVTKHIKSKDAKRIRFAFGYL